MIWRRGESIAFGSADCQPAAPGSLPGASATTENRHPTLSLFYPNPGVRGKLPRTAGWRHALPIADFRAQRLVRVALLLFTMVLGLSSCVAPDTRHRVVISVPEQRMALLDNGALMATFPVSTSKFTLGDSPGSLGTPLGELQIAEKIGGAAPSGTVFKDRRRTGEILPPDAPGRDPIVTRILWLRGLEPQNANAYSRYIYIHGTPEERNIGRPASYGCVRMRSRDVIQLYDIVGRGAKVTIVNEPLEAVVQTVGATTHVAEATNQ